MVTRLTRLMCMLGYHAPVINAHGERWLLVKTCRDCKVVLPWRNRG